MALGRTDRSEAMFLQFSSRFSLNDASKRFGIAMDRVKRRWSIEQKIVQILFFSFTYLALIGGVRVLLFLL